MERTDELEGHPFPSTYFSLLFLFLYLLDLDHLETIPTFRPRESPPSLSSFPLMNKQDMLWRSNSENVATFSASQCTVNGPESGSILELSKEYTFLITAEGDSQNSRPTAGAHFEVLLHSHQFRSRPRIEDMNDGNYTLTFIVPGFSWLEGSFTLEIFLLCSGGGGIGNNIFVGPSLVDVRTLHFIMGNSMQPLDFPCGLETWKQPVWSGYWIIQPATTISEAVGYERQFQETLLPLLDNPKLFPSNPKRWTYRLHNCFFPVRTASQSQICINSSWIFMHGDSNMQDTFRNLALNALQLKEDSATSLPNSTPISLLPVHRTSDLILRNESFYYRSSLIFNGAYPPNGNHQALHVYSNPDFLKSLKDAWTKSIPPQFGQQFLAPSFFYMNDAGLHGAYITWGPVGLISYLSLLNNDALPTLEELHRISPTSTIKNQASFWLWRNTITPAGNFRTYPTNPHKVEVLNHLVALEIQEHSRKDPKNIQWSFIDAFDITYPWHFDNSLSDGGHYGRYGNSMVDDMLVQVLLHFYCSFG